MSPDATRFAAATAALIAVLAAALVLAARGAASPAPLRARSVRGDAEATFEFARRVELGIGTAPDPAEAALWYEIAEDQGHPLPADVAARLFP